MSVSFDKEAAAFIHKNGKAKVRGQAFYQRANGRVLKAVGSDVLLVPRTAYADEWFATQFGDEKITIWRQPIDNFDIAFKNYMRVTVASSGGSFSFDEVADGEYYVLTRLLFPGERVARYIGVRERVKVEGGRSVRVVLRGY